MAKMFDGPQDVRLDGFAKNVDRMISQSTLSLLQSYTAICRMFHDNPNFRNPDGTTNSDLTYEAFAEYTSLRNDDGNKVTPEQIGQLIMTMKAVINVLRPETVVDDVPVVAIDAAPVRLQLDRVVVSDRLTQMPDVLAREQERLKQERLDREP